MWLNPRETADLVTFTEEILNWKLNFLSSSFIKNIPPEDFCKKGCSEKVCKVHRKTPAMELFFNKAARLYQMTKKW